LLSPVWAELDATAARSPKLPPRHGHPTTCTAPQQINTALFSGLS
jgi:hypothetical protein